MKGVKEFLDKYRTRNFTAQRPEKKAAKKPNIVGVFINSPKLEVPISIRVLIPAPRITGIPKRKANFIDSSLESPKSNPPEIVEPEREKPGIRAKLWNIPIKNPFIPDIPPLFLPSLSARKNNILPAIRA